MAAIFGKKKKEKEEKKEISSKEDKVKSSKTDFSDGRGFISQVLLNPRITEKASEKSMNQNVYVFNVDNRATKKDISKAVLSFYKVSPLKVSVVKIPRKEIIIRGKKGMRPGGKKAYVYLKKGDKIEFV